jgi:hypothetical protein
MKYLIEALILIPVSGALGYLYGKRVALKLADEGKSLLDGIKRTL